jgi:cell division transport system permease protein
MATNLSASTNPVRRWFKLHTRNCADSLEGLRAQPVATTLTMLVIGIALALPGALNLVVQNGRNLAGSWESARDFSVYLTPGEELAVAEKLATELKKREQIDSVQIVTAADALVEFRESSGLGEVLDSLDSNPLPHTLIVRPKDTATGDQLAEIGADLDKRPEVDIVKIDTQWVERLNAILDFLNRVVIIATVLLVAAVIIIIGNTIRLDIQNRRDEIEVLKLLGASNGFVRRPFLYVGLWYGLIGGIVALLLMVIGGWLLTAPLEHLIGLYESDLSLLGLDASSALIMVAGGVLAGWGGAWTAVSRHLAAIQPK